jgi:signal transduction histidine kinase
MQQSSLNQSLKIELEKLPSMPHALLQLLEVVSDPDADFDQISALIQADPALMIKVMSIANSGANYQLKQYKRFNHLIVGLGLKTVKTIIINSAIQQFFSQFNVDDKGLLAQFWQASLVTAGIAESLAHIIGSNNEDEAYIAGLLHKLGELVCLSHNADTYSQKISEHLSNGKNKSLYEQQSQQSRIEHDFIGASIPEIGASIVNDIAKNSLLGDAILYQRESAKEIIGAPYLVQVVNLAQKLAETFSTDNIPDNQRCEFNNSIYHEVSDVFDLNQPLLENMLKKCYSNFLDTAKSMGIAVNDDNKIEPDTHKVQIALAENVRTIALSSSLQQINIERLAGRPEKELIIQIIQQLNILFDLPNSLFLSFDADAQQLHGLYGSTIPEHLLSQFTIPLTADATLAVQSLLKKKPVSSQDTISHEHSENKKSVLDRQLLRLLNAQELLCIPLLNSIDNKYLGVLVSGLSSIRLQKIKREKGLLYEFSKASSEVISHDRNITEQVQSAIEEEKSLQSLEIRKLVHEANNPLGVIRNYLQVLSLKMADSQDTKLQGQLDILMEEVERVGQIILRIRDTPKQSDISNDQVNLNALVQNLVSIFEESLFVKAGIVADINLDESIPLIKSDSNSLKQILTNLLKNATEAMPDGGEIHVKTRDYVNYNGKQFIELSISDTGPGIPNKILNNLFNPVKSTKSGEHSGLGLSIIKNLVNDLGGTISGSNLYTRQLSSNSGRQKISGAEFLILLPRRLFNE